MAMFSVKFTMHACDWPCFQLCSTIHACDLYNTELRLVTSVEFTRKVTFGFVIGYLYNPGLRMEFKNRRIIRVHPVSRPGTLAQTFLDQLRCVGGTPQTHLKYPGLISSFHLVNPREKLSEPDPPKSFAR